MAKPLTQPPSKVFILACISPCAIVVIGHDKYIMLNLLSFIFCQTTNVSTHIF